MSSARPPYRADIDGLRAVAVALVIGYHARSALLPGGFVGVDVFFVISGYLITQLILHGLQQRRFTLAGFYRRRVRRIVPPLLVVLAACCLFGWFTLLPGEFSWLGKQVLWCTPFLANVFFGRYTGYWDPGADSNVLLHLWSLGVEEQFYLVWPLLLMLAVSCGVVQRVLIAVLLTSLGISAWGAWHAPIVHFYLPGARAWELALGALLAARGARIPGVPVRVAPRTQALCSLTGFALIIAAACLLSERSALPGVWGLVPAGGAALVIAAGPLPLVNRSILGCAPMTWVGRISYSLYLWHWPMFSFARIVTGAELSATAILAIIGLAVAAAWATYELVEVPIRYGAVAEGKAVPALLAGLVGFTALGAAIATERVSARLAGPAFARWTAATQDWFFEGETRVDARTGFVTLFAPGDDARTALFIGDSHLQQYWARVRTVTERNHAARSALFATNTACLPLPGVESLRQPRNCLGFLAYATELASRDDVDTVVFGAFWEVYLLGEFQTGHRQGVFRASDPWRRELQFHSAATELALERFELMIGRMVASGRRVFLVLSNPTSPRFDPAARIRPGLRLSLHPAHELELDDTPVDSTDYEAFVAPVMDRLREIATRTGAKVLDPRSTLCVGTRCAAIGADGMPLYVDSNHVRAAWAREAAGFLDETLVAPEVPPVRPARAPQRFFITMRK